MKTHMILFLLAFPCLADISISWDRSLQAGVAGYRAYADSGESVAVEDVCNTTVATFTKLPEGRHEISLTCYLTTGIESERSESITIRTTNAYSLDLEVSTDAVGWTTVARFNPPLIEGPRIAIYDREIIELPAPWLALVSITPVRIEVQAMVDGEWVSVYETHAVGPREFYRLKPNKVEETNEHRTN